MRFLARLFLLIPLGILLAAFSAGSFLVIAGSVQPQLGGAITDGAIATIRALFENLLLEGEALERFARLAKGLTSRRMIANVSNNSSASYSCIFSAPAI